jgi:hypothetical protein
MHFVTRAKAAMNVAGGLTGTIEKIRLPLVWLPWLIYRWQRYYGA